MVGGSWTSGSKITGTPAATFCAPDSGGDPRNGETTIHSAAGRRVDIISNGVHKGPIRWHVTSAQPLGSVDGVQEARLTGRVRFSLYAAPDHIVDSNLSTVTNKKVTGKADDIVDDLSLLITVQNTENENAPMEPDWDIGRKPSTQFTEQQVIDFNDAMRAATIEGARLFRDVSPPTFPRASQVVNWSFDCKLNVTDKLE